MSAYAPVRYRDRPSGHRNLSRTNLTIPRFAELTARQPNETATRDTVARRTVLVATAATLALGAAAPSTTDTAPVAATAVCTLTKGDRRPLLPRRQYVRADITEGKAGFPLELALTVVDDDTCATIGDALVEIWHCDALGEYSGHVGDNEPDSGTLLRGGVLTDAGGVARTTLAQDSIYDDGGAASGLLTLTALGSSPSAGYSGTLTLGVER